MESGRAPRLQLFGLPALLDGERVGPLPLQRPTYLLLVLALRGEWISREELTRLLRTDDEEPSSRGSLRLLLTRARRLPWASLAPLESGAQRVRWPAPSDVQQFREAVAAGRWEEATTLYGAPLLRGLPLQGLPGLHDWLEGERAALQTLWLTAVHAREAELGARGDFAGAATLLRRALSTDPLSEDTLQRVLRASLRAGQRHEALQLFGHFSLKLREELNLEPLPQTLALVEALRQTGTQSGEADQATEAQTVASSGGSAAPALIGRAAQRRQLGARMARARAAQPRVPDTQSAPLVTLLSGESGSGKTRLLQTQPGSWVRCAAGLSRVPYLPLLNAVRELDVAESGPDVGPDVGPDAGSAVGPHIGPESGTPGAPPGGSGLKPLIAAAGHAQGTPDSDRERLFAALLGRLGAGPGVIFDDLQWADSGTLDWLRYAAQRGVPVCGAFRPDEISPALQATLDTLEAAGGLEVIALTPLSADDLGALASAFSPVTGRWHGFPGWLQRRSGGNPQFALEWLRFLRQEGALQGGGAPPLEPARGHPQASAPGDLGRPPGALPELVRRRLEGLSAADRRVLDAGSVLGGVLSPARLSPLVEQSGWEVGDALGRAARLELLGHDGRLHDTVRQTLYDALSGPQQRFIHGRVVQTLAGVLDALELAEHAALAGEEPVAARLWFEGARYSFGVRRGFEQEASALYRRVLQLRGRSPDWYRACAYLAVRERVDGRADEARALIDTVLRESDDRLARAVARAEGASLAYLAGRMDEATRLIGLAAEEAAPLGDPGLARDILLIQANTAHYRGEYETALHIAEGVVEAQRREPLSHGGCNWLSTLAANLCALGRFGEALEYYREQLEAARFLGLRGQQVTASSDIIATLHDLGRIQEGVELAEAALELVQFNDTYPLRYHIALAYSRSGRHGEALDQLREVMNSASVNMRAHALALLAEVHLQLDATPQAHAALRGGLELVEGCDILTARGVMATALLQFAPAPLLQEAWPLIAGLRPETLPAYLRGDFESALAGRRGPGALSEPLMPGSALPGTN
ncbi:ATP-binding protein [Deinococcus koreensis]|uniref:Bacterial transcriptional activator domain-containing protein n=1 Tax=Deinococcus koreensis TaxID=2054903 RepID=A0A2K3UXR6_9DEIO|nr:BTAD domain-containing putative transcriptional regulator [Deinococcus koreensis]PNY81332.1 hypothetical protein CVO96_07990 [Deinococcus koreensis]